MVVASPNKGDNQKYVHVRRCLKEVLLSILLHHILSVNW